MAKKPTLGFPTVTAAKKNAQRILREYEDRPGTPITGEDAEFVTTMLRNHPSADEKIGPGIAYHCVMPDDKYSRGFRTMRTDGKLVPWSYPHGISGKHRTPEQQLKQTLRDEVDRDVRIMLAAYDRDIFGGYCYLSCKPLAVDEGEAHHNDPWPFHQIVIEWMHLERIAWDDPLVVRVGTGVTRLADRDLAERWRKFHKEHADIVRVSKGGHKKATDADKVLRAKRHYELKDFEPYEPGEDDR